MQHREQDTEHRIQNTQRTTQHTDTEHREQYTHITCTTSTENSAHNYRTYSLDYYNEYAYIKNSDTIEVYTISKENI